MRPDRHISAKRIVFYAVALLAAAFLVMSLTACSGEITSLSASVSALRVKVGGSVDLSEYIEKKGGGELMYSAENADVIELRGSVVKGLKEGSAAVVVMGGEFTVRINIEVSDGTRVNLTFPDVTTVYTGDEYNVAPVGDYPEGTEIKYYLDGELFTGAKNAGVYEITAEVVLPDGYILDCDDFTAVLTINKAHYNMSGVTFANRIFTYDGLEKTVTVAGVLPEGISVTYRDNRAVEAGTYRATATFSGEDPNYEEIGTLTSVFRIEPALVTLSEKGLASTEKTYDGERVAAEIDGLPSGAVVEYYLLSDKKEYVLCAEPIAFTDSGEYVWYARITIDGKTNANYRFVTENEIVAFSETDGGNYVSDYLPSTVKINKAKLSTGKFVLRSSDGETADFALYGKDVALGQGAQDGGYSLRLEGEMPFGVKGEFEGSVSVGYAINGTANTESLKNPFGNLDSGLYVVTAAYSMPDGYDANYLAIEEVTYNLRINKATYDASGITFAPEGNVYETEYDGTVKVFAAQGVDEEELSVDYVIRKDGITKQEVLHAGAYKITAKFTVLQDANNYNAIPDMTIDFTVKPRKITLTGITFADKETVYNGENVAMAIATEDALPEKVTVEYPQGSNFVNAGVYDVSAKFYYDKEVEIEGDYSFTINGSAVSALYARLTIKKAGYTAEQVGTVTPKQGLNYYYGMKLSAVGFENNEEGFLRWEKPDDLIGEMTSTKDDGVGEYAAYAVYNADPVNYENYRIRAAFTLVKAQINLEGTTVPDQFVARNAAPVVKFRVDYSKETVASIQWTGANEATVTIVAEKPNNYVLSGNAVFEKVKIYSYDPNEFSYKAGTTLMTGYNGAATIISVPYGTTETSARIFDTTASAVARVTQISVPETVVLLPENAFYGASYLEKIIFESLSCTPDYFQKLFGAQSPDGGVKITVNADSVIEESKFRGTPYLTEVVYNQKITSIGKDAFNGCTSLKKFTFDCSSLVSVGEYAFSGCVALESLTLPSIMNADGNDVALSYYFETSNAQLAKYTISSVALVSEKPYAIVDNAFAYMSSIKKLTISSAVTGIGKNAFRSVAADIDLSGSAMTALGTYAFAGYSGANLALPSGLTEIGSYAFKDATNLTAIKIPAKVASIGREAFSGCKAEIEFLGNAYAAVGERAFYAYGGKSVALPSSVTVVGEEAFAESSIESITVAGQVTGIGKNAFKDCLSLTEFTVGESVTVIGAYAFYGCSLLTLIRFDGVTPPAARTSVFDTKGAVITVQIKTNKDAFKNYFEACGAGDHVIISIVG